MKPIKPIQKPKPKPIQKPKPKMKQYILILLLFLATAANAQNVLLTNGEKAANPLPITAGGTGSATQLNALNSVLPTQATHTGKALVTDGTNATWTAIASSTGTALNLIQAATAINTINNTNFAQNWNWSTATTQTPLSISAAALTTGALLSLTTPATAAALVVPTGRVGIGTTTPAVKLTVNAGGTGEIIRMISTGSNSFMAWYQNSTRIGYWGDGTGADDRLQLVAERPGGLQLSTTNASGNIFFMTNGSNERMRILSNGNIGIGTITPTSNLHTIGSVANSRVSTTVNLTLDATHYIVMANNGAAAMTITLPTAVGIVGRTYIITRENNSSTGVVTIQAQAGQVVQALSKTSANTTTLAASGNYGQSATFTSDGANWYRVD